MKTLLKKIGLLITMITMFCGTVNAQGGFFFSTNGTVWFNQYKNPNIAGVAGDTIMMAFKMNVNDSDFSKVICANTTNAITVYLDTVKIIKVIVPDTLTDTDYTVYDSAGFNIAGINMVMIYPKFIPSNLVLSDSSENKSTLKVLTIKDFNIVVNHPAGGYNAYYDSIRWYRNDTLIHNGTDTSYIALLSGNYNIKVRSVYVTKTHPSDLDSCMYARWKLSNTVVVVIDSITTSIGSELSQKTFSVYPNPATTYLNLSEETTFLVFSVSGQEVSKGSGNRIDVSNFKSGVYILKTLVGDTRFVVN